MTSPTADKLVFETGVPGARSIADRWIYKFAGRVVRTMARLSSATLLSLWKRGRQNWPGKAITSCIEVLQTTPGNVPVVWLAPGHSSNGVIVQLHGGAYVSGPMARQWNWMAEVHKRTSAAMAMLLYRMPPDHPYPAALDDAVNAILDMQKSGHLVAGKWILCGDSSGGGLALAVVSRLIEMHCAPPAGLLLTAPWVDLAMNSAELDASERSDGFLHRSWLGWAARLYAGGRSLEDPLLSPLFGSFKGFPPVHINIGTRDMLLPDVRRLRDKLLAADVFVHYMEQDGGIHTYPFLLETREAQATVALQVKWIKRTLCRDPLDGATQGVPIIG